MCVTYIHVIGSDGRLYGDGRLLGRHGSFVTHDSQQSEEDNNSEGEKGDEGIGIDVGVSGLEHLDYHQPSNDEHERSVFEGGGG